MKPFEINQIQRLCREQQREFGGRVGGTPTNQRFGDVADPGTSEIAASIDHRHGLEELPSDTVDSLDVVSLVWTDFAFTAATSNQYADFGTVTFPSTDDVAGEAGGFGVGHFSSGAAANNGSGFLLSQNGAGNPDAQTVHYAPRLLRFEARLKPVLLEVDLSSMRFVAGGWRVSTTERLDLITQGVYFELHTDGAGVGTYHAKITDASVDTFDVDTGISPRSNGTDVLFDFFRIDHEITNLDPRESTTSFYMGELQEDGTVVWNILTSTDVTLPGSGSLIAGWGAAVMTEIAADRTMAADYAIFKGLRTAV